MRITVVTSSRADWNATGMVVKALEADPAFDVSVYCGCASGEALDALKAAIDEDEVPRKPFLVYRSMNLTKDDGINLGVAAGRASQMAAEAFWTLAPDMVFLPGDRFEIASVAVSAALAGIPIAHLGGGDATEGSYDQKFRDAITAMADVHFVTNERAFDRIRFKDGKDKDRENIHWVGSPAIDRIMQTQLMSELESAKTLGIVGAQRPLVVVNWQPETASSTPNAGLAGILLALQELKVSNVVLIGPNPDAGCEKARWMLGRSGWKIHESLPPKVYLSLLSHCDCLIGNSSSGIIEAPVLGCPVINVGSRQNGRTLSTPIMSCSTNKNAIAWMLERILKIGRPVMGVPNTYGDGHACEKIVGILKRWAIEHGKARTASVA